MDGSEIYEADIYIKDGKIAAISKEALAGSALEETNAQGCHVLPGLMDIHIHLRDPGPTYEEDFYHSHTGGCGRGITTVFRCRIRLVNSKTFQLVYNYKPDEPDIIPPFRDGEVLISLKKSQRQVKCSLFMRKTMI